MGAGRNGAPGLIVLWAAAEENNPGSDELWLIQYQMES